MSKTLDKLAKELDPRNDFNGKLSQDYNTSGWFKNYLSSYVAKIPKQLVRGGIIGGIIGSGIGAVSGNVIDGFHGGMFLGGAADYFQFTIRYALRYENISIKKWNQLGCLSREDSNKTPYDELNSVKDK